MIGYIIWRMNKTLNFLPSSFFFLILNIVIILILIAFNLRWFSPSFILCGMNGENGNKVLCCCVLLKLLISVFIARLRCYHQIRLCVHWAFFLPSTLWEWWANWRLSGLKTVEEECDRRVELACQVNWLLNLSLHIFSCCTKTIL